MTSLTTLAAFSWYLTFKMSNIWAVGSGRWSNLVTRLRVAVEMSVGEPVGRCMVFVRARVCLCVCVLWGTRVR